MPKMLVVDYHQTIERDRKPGYGKTVQYEPMLTDRIQMGSLPGWSYGFQGVTTNGPVRERYVSYLAFDGSQTVYIVTTGFDPATATGKFARLQDLEQFQPHLRAIVATLKLGVAECEYELPSSPTLLPAGEGSPIQFPSPVGRGARGEGGLGTHISVQQCLKL